MIKLLIIVIFNELLLDNESIKARIKNLDYIRMPALSQNIDFSKKAFQAFFFIDHILNSHNLDSYLLHSLQVNCQFHFGIPPFSNCFYNLILII